MNRNGIKGCLLILIVCLLALLSTKVWAQNINPTPPPLFTDQELDDLLERIALYPDPLLAQILPASTYTEEILDAYDWLGSGASISEIDSQRWDESVKAVAHYPDVLKMMAENADWTADLGDAFLNQPEDVTNSIQRLRWQARNAGNLQNNNQQTVVIVGNYIEIVPAQPQYIYIPSYDPSVVYEESPYDNEPFITFGAGLMIGGWLTMDFDWGNHHVIYHGWKRPGWVNHARPYVHLNNVYVHKSRPDINKYWRHDASHGTPDSYRTARPGGGFGTGMKSRMAEIRGRSVSAAAPSRPSPKMAGPMGDTRSLGNRGREGSGIISSQPKPPQDVRKQPVITIPDVSKRVVPRTSNISKRPEMPVPEVSKGTPQPRVVDEGIQHPKTPSVTFGGYRGASEARGQSLRGQASRQSSERARPPAAPTIQRSSPEGRSGTRGDAPAGKRDAGGKPRR
jgi:hypothetical protein